MDSGDTRKTLQIKLKKKIKKNHDKSLKNVDINFYVSRVENKFVLRDNLGNMIIRGVKLKNRVRVNMRTKKI